MMKRDKEFLKLMLNAIENGSLRMTRKRKRLLETLLKLDRPVPASELRDKAGLPESDLVTVYRALEAFEGIGIIQRIPLEESGCLFELTEPQDHHHHFVCRECHRTERLDLCLAQELENQAQRLGFTEVTHLMEVYGFCKECRPASALGT